MTQTLARIVAGVVLLFFGSDAVPVASAAVGPSAVGAPAAPFFNSPLLRAGTVSKAPSNRPREEEIDFNNTEAMRKWLGLKNFEGQYRSYGSEFEHGVIAATEKVLASGKWTVKAIRNYYNDEEPFALGVEYGQVGQNPETFKKFITDSVQYVYKAADPDRHLVLFPRTTYVSASYNPEAGDAVTAKEFMDEVKAEETLNSIYRAGVLELKETGLIGFLPQIRNYSYSWDSIILAPALKSELRRTIEDFLNHYDYATWKKLGLPMNRGLLLDGPPGTGKSLIAKILITEVLKKSYKNRITYFHVVARHMITKDAVKRLYDAARLMSPAIVYIEDIDLIAGTDRQDRADVKNELMQQLSGIEELNGVITIATTNVGDKIDEALKRSKRLGFHFHIGAPAYTERVELFKLFTSKAKTDGIEFGRVADLTEGLTGADLQEIATVAVETAVRDGAVSADGKVVLSTDRLVAAHVFRKNHRLTGN